MYENEADVSFLNEARTRLQVALETTTTNDTDTCEKDNVLETLCIVDIKLSELNNTPIDDIIKTFKEIITFKNKLSVLSAFFRYVDASQDTEKYSTFIQEQYTMILDTVDKTSQEYYDANVGLGTCILGIANSKVEQLEDAEESDSQDELQEIKKLFENSLEKFMLAKESIKPTDTETEENKNVVDSEILILVCFYSFNLINRWPKRTSILGILMKILVSRLKVIIKVLLNA
jgi:hypothetical protein